MKEYIKPELKVIAFGGEDIIRTSSDAEGEVTKKTAPVETINNIEATPVAKTSFSMFEE